ncbi:hypothetical protein D3C80_1639870 [compost metagenome]
MDAPAGRHRQAEGDFIAARPIPYAHLGHAEVAAHIGGLDMAQGNHHPGTATGYGLGGRDYGFRVTQRLAHGPTAGFVPDRPMLQFTILAHNRPFTIRLHLIGPAQRDDQAVGQLGAQGAQLLHEGQQIFHVFARIGVFHDCRRHCDPQRGRRDRAAFLEAMDPRNPI